MSETDSKPMQTLVISNDDTGKIVKLSPFDKISEILEGIDKTESEDGWWPTSVGAEFGKKKLEEIKEFLEKYSE